VLNVFAPDCGFCKRHIPVVEAVRSTYEEPGVRFVNVSERMREAEFTRDQIIEVLRALRSNIEVTVNEDNLVGGMFKAIVFPTLFIIDRAGAVRHVAIGAK
jgi:thiol-disulfide isomerase/thioredoxin